MTFTHKTDRKYYIDWLRIALIISVFFFHLISIFSPYKWHINSENSYDFLRPIIWWLAIWRMPLLFLVSGVGTFYAIGQKSIGQYVMERSRRLLIPLVIGCFTIVPFMVYLERIDQYTSLWQYFPHMFDGGAYPKGNFSWHHLWFIAYLFLISMLALPYIHYSRSGHYLGLQQRISRLLSRPLALSCLVIPVYLSQVILRSYFPNETHAVYNDWAYIVYYMLFFLIGFSFLTDEGILNALVKYRRLYATQLFIASVLFFTFAAYLRDYTLFWKYSRGFLEMTIALSAAFTAIAFFKKYFNRNSLLRKRLNEAIYPFYILHQPALFVTAFFILGTTYPDSIQIILIIQISLLFIGLLYWIIQQSNLLRLAFGLKVKSNNKPSLQKVKLLIKNTLR